MNKQHQHIKCAKCNLEFPESELCEDNQDKAFVWNDMVVCGDCLVDLGVTPSSASSFWDFKNRPV
jgi:hypothetical protein